MYINDTFIRVRYAETDQMGIVHHSNYYVWFELARDEFVESLDLSYKQLESDGLFMPLVETNCKYISPALYSERLRISTYIKELTPVKIIFGYDVFKEGAKRPIAKGTTIQAFVDSNFHIINLKKKYPELFEKFNPMLDVK
ncbi:acyl-CoA thioesterase [Clostridium oryzae]|uniref:Putative esterase n=1 Tax=Clostridium oryzae TaxID=1450648 RepID=A0A1V4IRJ5_9CLOT|nr:thioesterase family protein [Clostridium oryzae]OPJ62415.1 putative esterase [Clostridium oryzae]